MKENDSDSNRSHVTQSSRMRPRDWFEVGARLVGVWTLVMFAEDLRTLFDVHMGYFKPLTLTFMSYVVHSITDAAIGFYLLFSAGHLTGMVYGQEPPEGFEVEPAAALEPSDKPE